MPGSHTAEPVSYCVLECRVLVSRTAEPVPYCVLECRVLGSRTAEPVPYCVLEYRVLGSCTAEPEKEMSSKDVRICKEILTLNYRAMKALNSTLI